MGSFVPTAGSVQRQWYVIDAEDVVLGRVATEAARLLQGKHKAVYTPHIDTGDHVVIVNAAKVRLVWDWAATAMWLVCDPTPRLRNYWKYHRTPEQKALPSEPSEPTRPNQTDPKPPISPKGGRAKKGSAPVYSLDFERAWKMHRYGSKQKAWEAWMKAGCHALREIQQLAFHGLAEEAEWRERAEIYKRVDPSFFIPEPTHLSTWLNQKRWEQGLKPIPERSNNGRPKNEPKGFAGIREWYELQGKTPEEL